MAELGAHGLPVSVYPRSSRISEQRFLPCDLTCHLPHPSLNLRTSGIPVQSTHKVWKRRSRVAYPLESENSGAGAPDPHCTPGHGGQVLGGSVLYSPTWALLSSDVRWVCSVACAQPGFPPAEGPAEATWSCESWVRPGDLVLPRVARRMGRGVEENSWTQGRGTEGCKWSYRRSWTRSPPLWGRRKNKAVLVLVPPTAVGLEDRWHPGFEVTGTWDKPQLLHPNLLAV